MFLPFFQLASLGLLSLTGSYAKTLPSKIYGVNLGSWLVLEPWMLPAEWATMGGESCAVCSDCIGSEFAFVQAYPDTADDLFAQHWDTWFTQSDVDTLASLGINTVRVPLGFWIVEALVDRTSEYYPRGGFKALKRGLRQLSEAGILVLLDHHGLPGVQDANQAFTGHCTADVEFYTDDNYKRALIWTAVMTTFSHVDPDFASVVAIEAVNEPIMDASQTPGYGNFQKQFVEVVRTVETALGIHGSSAASRSKRTAATASSILTAASSNDSLVPDATIQAVLAAAAPIIKSMAAELEVDALTNPLSLSQSTPLYTTFMDVNWQYNDPPNPADVSDGPQLYDNHLYYSFGGVANATEEAYLTSICNLNRVQNDAALGNSPLVFGEWGLPTQFQATDDFLYQWADAQKLAYSQGAGWIFWNFKIEISDAAGDLARQWSYIEGVRLGFLTEDPSAINNSSVCDPYVA